jgi:hypothetical protein
MRRLRFLIGMALIVVATAFTVRDQQVAWISPILMSVPVVLMGIYGLAAILGLDGPRIVSDSAFGLALFGGVDLILGSGWTDPMLMSHVVAKPIHIRMFNAIQGTKFLGDETTGGFLAPSDPTIVSMQMTRTAAFQGASLAWGLVGAIVCVVLGRFAPLPRWRRSVDVALVAAGLLGVAAWFLVGGWWASFLAFQVVYALFLASAMAARYGPTDRRPAMFGFALIGGVVFVLGGHRWIATNYHPSWIGDPIAAAVLSGLSWDNLGTVYGGLITGYLPSSEPRFERIRMEALLANIPVGLIGAVLGMTAAWLSAPGRRPRFRMAGSAVLMVIVAASTIVLMAFREPDTAWHVAESQMILLVGVLAAFRARFGPVRGRSFLAGFAIFGLAHAALILSYTNLKWNSPLTRPVAVAAGEAWKKYHKDSPALTKATAPEQIAESSRQYARYTGTIDVAVTTTSLAAALLGGTLCALMVPPRRSPIDPLA